jgi:ABC-type dipeptide/oligopeptide/nickel transport system ATPase subunit
MSGSALLAAREVTVRYPGATEDAVRGVTMDVTRGASVGIVGESGSGKSTLARVLAGACAPTSGDVEVMGRRWRDVRRRDPLRRQVQMIFQDPIGSLNPDMSACESVAEVVRVWHGAGRRDASVRAEELLADVGLRGAAIDRRRHALSGGQCQRVGIARALACEPSVLIADEPTSSLDVSVQAQILNLLADLRTRLGLAMVLISHDLSVVEYMTDRTLVMYRGEVVEAGITAQLLSRPRHAYTRTLVDSVPGR